MKVCFLSRSSWIYVEYICGRGLPFGGALITDESLPPPTRNNVKWNTALVRLCGDRKCRLTNIRKRWIKRMRNRELRIIASQFILKNTSPAPNRNMLIFYFWRASAYKIHYAFLSRPSSKMQIQALWFVIIYWNLITIWTFITSVLCKYKKNYSRK